MVFFVRLSRELAALRYLSSVIAIADIELRLFWNHD